MFTASFRTPNLSRDVAQFFDRHATYVVAAYVAGAARRAEPSICARMYTPGVENR